MEGVGGDIERDHLLKTPTKTLRMRSMYSSFYLFGWLIHTIFTVFISIVKPDSGKWRDVTQAELHGLQYIPTTTKIFKKNVRKRFRKLPQK